MEKKILIVEDDADIQRSLKDMFTNYGYNIIQALNAEMALSVIDDEVDNLGLVITDMKMPGIGGEKLIEMISDIKENLPIIVFSGVADEYRHLPDTNRSVKAVYDKLVDFKEFKNAVLHHFAI